MAPTIYCYWENDDFPEEQFVEQEGRFVHMVDPRTHLKNGQPWGVEVHGVDKVAAAEAVEEEVVDLETLPRAKA
jgi:hypothetical protein